MALPRTSPWIPRPFGELGEYRGKNIVARPVVEHRQRSLQPAEPLDHRRGSLVVEVPAGELQSGDDAHDDLVDDGRQGDGVRTAHVSVADDRGERNERIDQVGNIWRRGSQRAEGASRGTRPVGKVGKQARR